MAKKKDKKTVMCYETDDKQFRYYLKGNKQKMPKELNKYHPVHRKHMKFTLVKP